MQDATSHDAKTNAAGLLQGDSTTVALQNSLRNAIQSVTTRGGAFTRLAHATRSRRRPAADPAKLEKALASNPDDAEGLFRNTGGGAADGIAVQLKALTANPSNDGFFKSKDDTLHVFKRNSQDQARVNDKVNAFEKRITQLQRPDTQLSSLNGLMPIFATGVRLEQVKRLMRGFSFSGTGR